MSADAPASCLFCRIVAGELAAERLGENELALAFRDINPGAPTHVLVVPKHHVSDASTLVAEDAEALGAMFLLAQRVAAGEGVDSSGYRLVLNVGDDAGNSVAHLHLHLLGGRRLDWPPG